ncbi:MAG TPA: hypothetical protein DCG19_05000 [Cryomorphaceae bacterium]|nr:hypothetical protein [Owenweeksia sp.]MBF98310.1 hypothetical protein [Owenweeksia sp.]HAD96741.1 hypothetical protein [Cryomorphaceae bacterium]HBF21232.1 hypothetical protein [Cryomorphaceae bacterium]|tara:strand:- start:29 stop:460 length:432 start_codon:yes stop_codon:yes gene_type:complete
MRTGTWKILFMAALLFIMLGAFKRGPQVNNGEDLYREYCKSCHQRSGKGFLRVYPPLTDPEWIARDERIVGNILNGIKGEIVVEGKEYDGEMPSFYYLSDNQIAQIVNYVRTEIAGTGTSIDSVHVARLRSELLRDSLKILTK